MCPESSPRGQRPAAVLFDFDGTLVDTFDGIVAAVENLRAQQGAAALPADEVRRHIGWGLRHLLVMCHPSLDEHRPDRLPRPDDPSPLPAEDLTRLVSEFRAIYREIMLKDARVYPGVAQLCRELCRCGVALAVVSNKPERFVRQLLAGLGMTDLFALVMGGDTLPERKPSAVPLQYAARRLGVPLERCVMVGDGHLDIEAAHAAAIPSCGVTWGLNPEERMRAFTPTHLVRTAADLRTCLAERVPELATGGPR